MNAILIFLILLEYSGVGAKILGKPLITCNETSVIVQMEMDEPFRGHLYLRGQYGNKECHKNFEKKFDMMEPKAEFEFNTCQMRRKRETNPRGLSFSSTLIVSHHSRLITYKDAAYDIECYFVDSTRHVKTDLQVSTVSPSPMQAHPALPTCEYTVLSSADNQTTKAVTVGDSVVHQWKCANNSPFNSGMYCMRVHSCEATDGDQNKYTVVDHSGCATDTDLILPIVYTSDLSATALSRVFKFADRTDMYFSCQLQLYLKSENNGTCPTPHCENNHRRRRSLSYAYNADIRKRNEDNFDIDSQRITVIEKSYKEMAKNEMKRTSPLPLHPCPIVTPTLAILTILFLAHSAFTLCFIFQKYRVYDM